MPVQPKQPEPDPFEEARAQACEYLGFMRSRKIQVGDEVWEIPNQSLLSPVQRRRYNELQLYAQISDELDRYPDVYDDKGQFIDKGNPKIPWRNKSGELVDDYDTRLVKAIWGDDKFDQFIELGGQPSDVGLYWAEFLQHAADRAQKDPKSGGGDRRLAAVPDSN